MRSTVKALGRFTSPPLSFEPSLRTASNRGRIGPRLLFFLLLPSLLAATPPRLGWAYFYKPPTDRTSAAFLAHHFQLIILTHGDEAYVAQLRHDGYRGPILQYVVANEVEGPGPYANSRAQCDSSYVPYRFSVADRQGVFCSQIHTHEDWFLHNRRGERLYARYQSAHGIWRTTYEMNPASRGWQQFEITRLRQYQHLGFNGFFLDNVDLSRSGLLLQPNNAGGLQEFATDSQFRTAVSGWLAALHTALPDVPLWANLTHDPERAGDWEAFLPYLTGVMVEDFALGWLRTPLSPAARAAQWDNIRQALARGASVLLVGQGTRNDEGRRRLLLSLAWALLPSRGGLYFRYNDAHTDDYRQVWWSPLYDTTPPAATGPLRRDGMAWVRPYPRGVLRIELAAPRAELPPLWAKRWGVSPDRGAPHTAPLPAGR